ncbi:hypothetical protein [Hafnia alvei]|jgi:hypothetical protein|uniref:hypothetical protein n=1 Tax=Hafnia alvei TaxID=569 RepID=UPI000AA60EE3|nr:hypothetical protein [Hafnia alvei]
MANNDITFTRPEHIAACPLWETERDVCRGPVAVKSRGHKYLPKFEPDNTTAKNNQRNADYLMRAVFYAITGQTKIGLLGLAYRRSPALAIPDRLDYLKTNAEGAGTSIYQQSQETLENILEVGRHGLYVDYNETDKQSVTAALVGASMAIGGVMQMIAPQPTGLSMRESPDNKPSYAFGGPVNTTTQGNPVGVLYTQDNNREIGGAIASAGIYAEDQQ